jgi:hypothetical protein
MIPICDVALPSVHDGTVVAVIMQVESLDCRLFGGFDLHAA